MLVSTCPFRLPSRINALPFAGVALTFVDVWPQAISMTFGEALA
jgi:hypothetical protein